jgi:ornithine cyclodeaminase
MPSGNNDILLLKGHEVNALLVGREAETVLAVESAYRAHARGESALPHSSFLRFPEEQQNRIIALPAYLGHEFNVAGIKWIASFPDNIRHNLDRASAILILNSSLTGRPEAIIEGSIISAKRTAASAALAARYLHRDEGESRAGLVGTGVINFEVARSLLATRPALKTLVVFDIDAERALRFREKCAVEFGGVTVEVAGDLETLLRGCPLVSIATTASQPYIADLSACAPGSTILHVSLRDIAPEAILGCDNILDDIDHVCRAQTSVHLAEQLAGNRDFLRCTLGDVLEGRAPARRDDESVAVFSPFGLGILDLAVGSLVRELAGSENRGTVIESFLPASWSASA